ncbi:MAG: YhdP family protein [Pseudomonadota bacterium]
MKPGRLIVSVLEGILLAMLVVAASYVSIGRTLVANVSGFRADIEAQLSRGLNVPVSIGSISGDWTYFDPMIQIDRLTIGGEAVVAVAVDSLFARVDAFASLWERNLVVRDLVVDGVRLDIIQDEAGLWSVRGMPRRRGGMDVQPLLVSLSHLMRVDISGVDINIQGQRRTYRLTNQSGVPFVLLADGPEKSLSMPLTLHQENDAPSRFELIGRYAGDPREFETFRADLYLQLPQLELSDLIPAGGQLSGRQSAFSGDFWLRCVDGEFEFVGRPLLESLHVTSAGEERVLLTGATANFSARGSSFRNMQVDLSKLELVRGEQKVWLDAVGLSFFAEEDSLSIGINLPALDLGRVARLVTTLAAELGVISGDTLAAAVALAPGGTLRNLLANVRLEPEQAPRFQVAGELGEVTLNSYRGSPGIEDVSGYFSMTERGGFVDVLDSGFVLSLPSTFSESWSFDDTRARIRVDLSGEFPVLTSSLMALNDGSMTAKGQLQINLAAAPVDRTWALELGIQSGELRRGTRYLPNTLPDDLRRWLDVAIVDGKVDEAGLLFHGTLDKTAPRPSKVFEMYFNISDGELVYAPEWPALEALRTSLYIGNWGVFTSDASGQSWGAEITAATVDVPLTFDVPPEAVFVSGSVRGDTSTGIRFLNETPLAGATGNMAAGWSGEGRLAGKLALTIPLGRDPAPVTVDLALALADSHIQMNPWDLDIQAISGQLYYTTSSGLAAERIDASLFGFPVVASIATQADEAGGAIGISVSGQVDMKSLLDWSGQPLLARTAGMTDYNAYVHVPFGDRAGELAWVEATSALLGVALDLPRPLAKSAAVPELLVYRQSFLPDGQRVDLTLGDSTRGSLKVTDGRLVGGRFHFGASPMGAITYESLKVSGDLPFANYDEWTDLTSFLEQRFDASLESEIARQLESIDLDIGTLEAFGMSLDRVATYISRGDASWNVGLTNEMLSGLIRVPDNDSPLDVSLEYLNLKSSPEPDTAGSTVADPLADTDPATLSAIDFQLDELNIDGENYGAWQFGFRPEAAGGRLEDLTAEVKGLAIEPGARVLWQPDKGTSQFEGRIRVPDLAAALKQWGFASSIEGEGVVIDAEVSWPGSPAMVDLDTMKGLVHLREGSGRFVQADSGTGALRLLGIFDFASLARRFRFDFSDVVNKGFSFSDITGTARLDTGRVSVVEQFVIEGAGSIFKVGGTVDLNTNELDNDMIVTLPLSRNLPWYAAYSAIATGPIVGAGVWLAQKVFENQINQMTSAKYRISGTIDQPVIEFVSIFNDSVREQEEQADEPESVPTPTPDQGSPGQ